LQRGIAPTAGVGRRRRAQAILITPSIPDNIPITPDVQSKEIKMAHYVDGFVVPVPKKNLVAYRRMANKCGKIWMEYGALHYTECIADDVKPGKVTSFPQAVKLKADETVVFSWIVYKSRKHRDSVNAKVMKDPRLAGMNAKTMPFDGKRMFWGGFKSLVAF
jgi:uncharacterized protein YbaA (DUF1428 family)